MNALKRYGSVYFSMRGKCGKTRGYKNGIFYALNLCDLCGLFNGFLFI